MVKVKLFTAALVLGICFCAMAEEKDHHDKPAHGGVILELGDEVAHLEFVHDEKGGKATIYLTGPDAKTALAITEAPKFNLKGKDGNKQVESKAVNAKDGAASQFEASDDAFKAHELKGRIVLVINGKKYNADLKDAHKH
jgi:hypothetical protein